VDVFWGFGQFGGSLVLAQLGVMAVRTELTFCIISAFSGMGHLFIPRSLDWITVIAFHLKKEQSLPRQFMKAR